MRVSKVSLVIAGLGVALTACTTNGGSCSAPSGTPTAAATTGSSAACVVGNWRSVKFDIQSVGGVDVNEQGGGGLTVGIAPDGKTEVNFDSMQPVTFDTKTG